MNESIATRESIERYAREHSQLGAEPDVTAQLALGLSFVAGTGAPVLDAGCGESGSLRALRRRSPAGWMVGCDLSLTRATLVRAEGFDAVVADCQRLPFATGSIGLAVLRHVIEHLEDEVGALREVSRVLRPDGLLYLETPLRLRGAWYWYRNETGDRVLDPTHLREYNSVDQVRGLAQDAGLEIIDVGAYPLRHPVGLVVHRLLHMLFRGQPRLDARLRDLQAIRRPSLPVPRYREIRLLARPARA